MGSEYLRFDRSLYRQDLTADEEALLAILEGMVDGKFKHSPLDSHVLALRLIEHERVPPGDYYSAATRFKTRYKKGTKERTVFDRLSEAYRASHPTKRQGVVKVTDDFIKASIRNPELRTLIEALLSVTDRPYQYRLLCLAIAKGCPPGAPNTTRGYWYQFKQVLIRHENEEIRTAFIEAVNQSLISPAIFGMDTPAQVTDSLQRTLRKDAKP